MEDPDSSLCSSMESYCATLARWYLFAQQYSQSIHPFYWPDKNHISSSPLLLCNVTSDIQKGQGLWHNRMTLLSSFAPHDPPTTLNIGMQLIMEITRMFKIPGLDRSFFWVWINESIRRLKCGGKKKAQDKLNWAQRSVCMVWENQFASTITSLSSQPWSHPHSVKQDLEPMTDATLGHNVFGLVQCLKADADL